MQNKLIFAAALIAAAIVNSLGVWTSPLSGDILTQNNFLRCFADAFWAGDLYPRWCTDANNGMGAPVFLFYFPLPFWIGSLLAPFFQGDALYAATVTLANLVTAFTAWWWLRAFAGNRWAIFGALLYLYAPYRMELMVYRTALAELWCMAWLPLLFHFTRQLTQGPNIYVVWHLTWVIALCWLSHVPTAAAAWMMCVIYLALTVQSLPLAFVYFAGPALLASAGTAFYLFPALLYQPFIAAREVLPRLWSNDFVSAKNLILHGHWQIQVGFVLTVALISVFALQVSRTLRTTPQSISFREATAWSVMVVISFYLLFRISAPFWSLINSFAILTYPWRMQAVLACALALLGTLWMTLPRKQRVADAVVLIIFLHLVGMFLVSERPEEANELFAKAEEVQLMPKEYRTVWTPPGVNLRNPRAALEQAVSKPRPKATVQIVDGEGAAVADTWNGCVMEIEVNADTPMRLKLARTYFPSWTVRGEGLVLSAAETGEMQLDVPAGKHKFQLQHSAYYADGEVVNHAWLLRIAVVLSLAAFLVWWMLGWRMRRY